MTRGEEQGGGHRDREPTDDHLARSRTHRSHADAGLAIHLRITRYFVRVVLWTRRTDARTPPRLIRSGIGGVFDRGWRPTVTGHDNVRTGVQIGDAAHRQARKYAAACPQARATVTGSAPIVFGWSTITSTGPCSARRSNTDRSLALSNRRVPAGSSPTAW